MSSRVPSSQCVRRTGRAFPRARINDVSVAPPRAPLRQAGQGRCLRSQPVGRRGPIRFFCSPGARRGPALCGPRRANMPPPIAGASVTQPANHQRPKRGLFGLVSTARWTATGGFCGLNALFHGNSLRSFRATAAWRPPRSALAPQPPARPHGRHRHGANGWSRFRNDAWSSDQEIIPRSPQFAKQRSASLPSSFRPRPCRVVDPIGAAVVRERRWHSTSCATLGWRHCLSCHHWYRVPDLTRNLYHIS